jgi:hypothetical protein
MIYDLSNNTDSHKASIRFEEYKKNGDRTELKKRRSNRSLNQNNLLWLWLSCIEDETGQDRNDLYTYFIKKFAPRKEVEIFGERQTVYLTTSKMNTKQMSKHLERIKIFSARELTISLPEPNDLGFNEFHEKYKYY